MEFSPTSAPVYGGGIIFVELPSDTYVLDGSRIFLVFTGSTQRQISEAKFDDDRTIQAIIPDHEPPEQTDLCIVVKSINSELKELCKDTFTFVLDQTCYLARYLADSVHVPDGLENWDDIQGPQFSLEHEDFETLDDRLTSAFEHLILPPNWSLLGDPSFEEHCRETLFHFAARLGLSSFVTLLLDKNGAEDCLKIRNKMGLLAQDIARDRGYHGLADLMTDPHAHGVIQWKSTQQIDNFTSIKRHSFGVVTSSSDIYEDETWPPLEKEIDILCEENSPIHNNNISPVVNSVEYRENVVKQELPPALPPKPKTPFGNDSEMNHVQNFDYPVHTFQTYGGDQEYSDDFFQETGDQDLILGNSIHHLQNINQNIHQYREKDIQMISKEKSSSEAARLSISCPDLGQDITLEYLDYDEDTSVSTTPKETDEDFYEFGDNNDVVDTYIKPTKFNVGGVDTVFHTEIPTVNIIHPNADDSEDVLDLEDESVPDEEVTLRPHSWHLSEKQNEQDAMKTNNRLSAPNLGHKRSKSLLNPESSNNESETEYQQGQSNSSSVISPAVRRVRRHCNNTFGVVGSQNNINLIDKRNSLSINNNNAVDDRRFTISEGVLSDVIRKSNNRITKNDCDRGSQSSDEQEMSLSEFLADPSNFENINSTKPPVPPRPDKIKVSRKLSFLSKMRNSTRMKPAKEKIKKNSSDESIITEEKAAPTESASDSRESLRELAWINVKSKVKKTSNNQRQPNMMINKLPTTYGSSLPNSSGTLFQGRLQAYTNQTRPISGYEYNPKQGDTNMENGERRYPDEDSISIHSGSRTPPSSSSHLTSMKEQFSSVEHLNENLHYYTELKKDPDLSLKNEEPETWNMTVEKKVLKKMSKKDIRRQENIYEFCQKEQNFLTTLKIMQKIFAQGMLCEAHVDADTVNKMFPLIDEFVVYVQNFVAQLKDRQSEREDKVVDEIGDLLLEQWTKENGELMIKLFSEFCCKQNEIVALYKDLLKNDKKFQDFMETSRKNPLTRRRGIQECLLLVTQRVTKYQILLKELIENSSDKRHKKDVENLEKAFVQIASITESVNATVQEYQKQQMLNDIYQSMDSKTVSYNDSRKFSKEDLTKPSRKLLQYAHNIQWRSKDSKKLLDVTLLLFTDCLVLLHESNQRYSFASNGQPSIVPLHKLIVRDIANELHGFYLISACSKIPEMYSLFCSTEDDSNTWMQHIRKAAQDCPEEDEGVEYEYTEEERLQERKWAEAHVMINELEKRDRKINQLLEEKMEHFRKLAALSDKEDAIANMVFRYPTYDSFSSNNSDSNIPPGSPILLKAIDQVAKLTHAMHGPSGVGRHPSSVGEGESGTCVPPILPKRSGTFGGFDNGLKEQPQSPTANYKNQSEPDSTSDTESTKRDSGLIMADIFSTIADSEEKKDPSLSPSTSSARLPLSETQMTVLGKLTHLLNQYLSVAMQQDTQMEKVKLELTEAKEKPNLRRKLGNNLQEVEALRYKSKQQEQEQELSKRQAQLLMEKMEWDKQREKTKNSLEMKGSEVENRFETVKKKEEELKREQEEVKKVKEDLQREMARLRDLQKRIQNQDKDTLTPHLHSTTSSSSLGNQNNSNSNLDQLDTTWSKSNLIPTNTKDKTDSNTYISAAEYPRTFPPVKRDTPSSNFSQSTINTSSSSSHISQTTLPIHLQYSAANQPRMQHSTPQLPTKLANPIKKTSSGSAVSSVHQIIPNKLSALAKSNNLSASKSGHQSKFTDGIKHKIPFGHHSKHSGRGATDDIVNLKHSKSESNMETRPRSSTLPYKDSSQITVSASESNSFVERSNSASSNSSKEGTDKKKKKHSSSDSEKIRNKEVYYL